jgi:hypothetical protein
LPTGGRSRRGQRSSFAAKPFLGHWVYFGRIIANKFSDGKDSPELREKDRTLCEIFDEKGP